VKRLSFALLLLAGCARREPLPVYQTLPAFQLTAQDGRTFSSQSELAGRIWVADFIFTNCTGPCPRMSRLMKQVHDQAKDLPEVRQVTFTVDPRNDTPEILAAYAKRYAADTSRWVFLTGATEDLHHLKREAFKLGDVDGSLNHSTRFVLVDRAGRVRGFYGTMEDGGITKLLADLRQLASEHGPS
jgi:cytochrome oxidase Cu insertion factor (SCO1/SenC/PrrC family)